MFKWWFREAGFYLGVFGTEYHELSSLGAGENGVSHVFLIGDAEFRAEVNYI